MPDNKTMVWTARLGGGLQPAAQGVQAAGTARVLYAGNQAGCNLAGSGLTGSSLTGTDATVFAVTGGSASMNYSEPVVWYDGCRAPKIANKYAYAQWCTSLGYLNQTPSSLWASKPWHWYTGTTQSDSMAWSVLPSTSVPPFYVNTLIDAPLETEAQKAERQQRLDKLREAERAAELRAEEVLLMCLNPVQEMEYRQHGCFHLQVNERRYRINKGRTGNVELIHEGLPVYRYCAHPDLWTPDQDVMLAQMLMLQTDEKRFLATANRTVLTRNLPASGNDELLELAA